MEAFKPESDSKMDSLINRGNVPGWTNLAIGEATVVREAYAIARNRPVDWVAEDIAYPQCEGLPQLTKAIMAYSIANGICDEDHPGHVVVTNGATQALLAAIHQYKKVYAEAPYWPRIPVLAGDKFTSVSPDKKYFDGTVSVVTFPNNPTGNDDGVHLPGESIIWDSVYASDIYGFNQNSEEAQSLKRADVIIGSMSKVFGMSGLRVGWAIFRKREEAELAAKYVETTTSGVSTLSQLMAIDMLEHNMKFEVIYKKVRESIRNTISQNAAAIKSVLPQCHMDGALGKSGGMFAWINATDDADRFKNAFNAAKVFVVRGDACGVSNNYFRLNCAASTLAVREAVEKLKKVF